MTSRVYQVRHQYKDMEIGDMKWWSKYERENMLLAIYPTQMGCGDINGEINQTNLNPQGCISDDWSL